METAATPSQPAAKTAAAVWKQLTTKRRFACLLYPVRYRKTYEEQYEARKQFFADIAEKENEPGMKKGFGEKGLVKYLVEANKNPTKENLHAFITVVLDTYDKQGRTSYEKQEQIAPGSLAAILPPPDRLRSYLEATAAPAPAAAAAEAPAPAAAAAPNWTFNISSMLAPDPTPAAPAAAAAAAAAAAPVPVAPAATAPVPAPPPSPSPSPPSPALVAAAPVPVAQQQQQHQAR